MNIWNELKKMTEIQLQQRIGSGGGDDEDKCPCCGRKIPKWARLLKLGGYGLWCTICGCKHDLSGITGWKI